MKMKMTGEGGHSQHDEKLEHGKIEEALGKSEALHSTLSVAPTVDGKFYPNLEGQELFKLDTRGLNGLVGNIVYCPNGEEVSEFGRWQDKGRICKMVPKIDYENGIVTFDLYIKELRQLTGGWVDPESDFSGRGLSSEPSYEEIDVLVGTISNKIEQMDMPVIFDDAEVFILYQIGMYGGDIRPILYRKDSENNLCSVAYWDDLKQKWLDKEAITYDKKTMFRLKEGEELTSVLNTEQLQMAQFQKVNIKPENSVLTSEAAPTPHLPGDDTPISLRRQRIVDRINEAKRTAAQQETELRNAESLAKLEQEAKILETRLGIVENVIGEESMEKLKLVLDLYNQYHDRVNDFPTELESLAGQWKRSLGSIDLSKELDPIQKTDIEVVVESIGEIDPVILEDYLSKINVKNWGVYSKIIVEGGQIFDATDYIRGQKSAIDRFEVGRSGRSLYRKKSTKNSVLLEPSGHWGREDEYELADGQYAIRRDVSEVYVVEFDDRGRISKVLENYYG